MISIEKIPNKMSALVLEGIGDLRLEEVDIPKLEKDMVLLKIKCCGICSSDIERVFINGTYHFPTVPGHEFSGQIVAVEDKKDESLLGKNACVFPLLPCMKCDACQKEEYAQCRNYNYFGSRCDGAFSEYLAIPKWNLILFEDLPYDIASLCEPSAVVLHAVRRVEVKPNDKVLVIGTGTIGIIASIILKHLGADVYISSRKPKISQMIEDLNIKVLDGTNLEKSMEEASILGFSHVFEAVGSNQAITEAIDSCDNFGSVVLIGNPKEDLKIPKKTYWKVLRKQLTLTGTWNSNYNSHINDWKDVLEFLKDNQESLKKVITQKYPLNEYQKAFEDLRDKDTFTIKVTFENK